ncbi:MAG: hypothetical protein GC146_06510 [Limimaricola sp.]|uniref:hypothetical protein n=1 Tax=Limimaricola sp. TaxID=2211665 RepID=UPI001D748EAA|nr:hypothetical protein [Limimaricola sp.]MBI1416860.1 hypothetical protein [Limimaricola sp.]
MTTTHQQDRLATIAELFEAWRAEGARLDNGVASDDDLAAGCEAMHRLEVAALALPPREPHDVYRQLVMCTDAPAAENTTTAARLQREARAALGM